MLARFKVLNKHYSTLDQQGLGYPFILNACKKNLPQYDRKWKSKGQFVHITKSDGRSSILKTESLSGQLSTGNYLPYTSAGCCFAQSLGRVKFPSVLASELSYVSQFMRNTLELLLSPTRIVIPTRNRFSYKNHEGVPANLFLHAIAEMFLLLSN